MCLWPYQINPRYAGLVQLYLFGIYGARHLVTATFVQSLSRVQNFPDFLATWQKCSFCKCESNVPTVCQLDQNWRSYCFWYFPSWPPSIHGRYSYYIWKIRLDNDYLLGTNMATLPVKYFFSPENDPEGAKKCRKHKHRVYSVLPALGTLFLFWQFITHYSTSNYKIIRNGRQL